MVPSRSIDRGVATVWINAQTVVSHVHVKVYTGKSYGQQDAPDRDGYGPGTRDNAGEAGTLIMHPNEWPPFIKALARGGADTGLRVLWTHDQDPHGPRSLWNGLSCDPCIVGAQEPVPWEDE